MAWKIKAELTGLESAMRSLSDIKRTVRNRILRKAVNAGSRLILKAARALVPKDTGLLKKSLAVRIQTYRRTGVVTALIGPRTGYKRTREGKKQTAFGAKMKQAGQNPAKYAHLVEYGRTTVHTKSARVLSDGSTVYGAQVKAVPPRPFLRPAFEQQKGNVVSAMTEIIRAELEKFKRAMK